MVGLLVVVSVPVATPAGAADPQVVINEIHYHAPEDDQDFLELHNPGSGSFDLSGACFTSGIGGCFAPGTVLPAGGYLVAAESPSGYAAAFPGGPAPALQNTGSLSNGGEEITLSLGGDVLDTVTYTDDPPWPLSPDGNGPSLELIDPLLANDDAAAWAASDPAPTPGAVNTRFGLGPQPVIGEVAVVPAGAGAPIPITAEVTGASTVEVEVTVGFGPPQTRPLFDDGAHGDGAAGDGRYGASLAGQPAGTLVRYRVRASSGSGTVTLPANGDPRPRLGFVVAPPAPTTPLPVIQWFIDPADYTRLLANAHTNDYVPAVIAYGSQVWDGAEVRVNGTVRFVPKLSFKFKMPNGHDLVAPGLVDQPVDEFVLDSDRGDSLGVTSMVALSVYADTNPYVPQHAKVRVHRNGAFHGLYSFVEEFEDNWMARTGLDQPGAEVYEPEDKDGVFVDEGAPGALVPTRFEQLEGDGLANLYALTQAIDAPPTPERAKRLRDLFDVPALVEFLAAGAIVQHWDQTVHNFVLIRDPATGRWRFAPHDLDNALGQPLLSPTRGSRYPALFPYGPDDLVSALRADPVFGEMYLRRLRSMADLYLARGRIQERADALAPAVAADLAADGAKWSDPYTQAQGRAQLTSYLRDRRTDLLSTHRRAGEVPAAPTNDRRVIVSELAYAATGGAAGDFVELRNPGADALDVSRWTLRGAATATLPPGTVIPARGYVIVPGDPKVGTWPSGTLVAGSLASGLADGGGTVEVRDSGGTVRGAATYGTSGAWPAAPATGAATLELRDPTTPGTGPGSWRASSSPAGSPASSGNPAAPPPPHRLAIEASADQTDVIPLDGAGTGFSVTVTNTGTASRPSVAVTGPGTTCARSIGTLAPGTSFTYRCRSTASSTLDRTFLFSARSGSVTASAAPVRVRTLRHFSEYHDLAFPGGPRAPLGVVRGGGRIDLSWQLPPAPQEPLRWVVVTANGPGRAGPTDGTMLSPRSAAELTRFPLDQPVQVAVALRNVGGTGPRTTPTPFLTPRSSATFPFASTEGMIRRFYADVDGRAATAGDVLLWQTALDSGMSPAGIVTSRLGTAHWVDRVTPIVRLYVAYFNRLPDQAGLDYWVARRRSGLSLAAVSAAFAAAPEFRARYGRLDHPAFVDQLYRNVFGRAPDPVGLWYWTARLMTGTSRGRVVAGFSESAEGRQLLAPMVQTSLAWTAMTRTTPSPAVAQPSVDWLRAGGSFLTVVESVRTSDAYARRVG